MTWRSDESKLVRILLTIIILVLSYTKEHWPRMCGHHAQNLLVLRSQQLSFMSGLWHLCSHGSLQTIHGLLPSKQRVCDAISVITLVRWSPGLPDLLCCPWFNKSYMESSPDSLFRQECGCVRLDLVMQQQPQTHWWLPIKFVTAPNNTVETLTSKVYFILLHFKDSMRYLLFPHGMPFFAGNISDVRKVSYVHMHFGGRGLNTIKLVLGLPWNLEILDRM